jgi:hypothetical protein
MTSKLSVKDILDSIKGDLGEEDYLEPLEILVDSLNEEANLSYFGVLGAKFQISNHLKTRVKILDYVKSHSLNQPSAPIFVMGLPRSGTTHLFNLLSQNSDHRSALFWEIMYPLPLAKEGSFGQMKKLLQTKLAIFFKNRFSPGLDDLHYIEATSPEECLLIKTLSLRSMVYVYMANIPSYQQYIQRVDFLPAFQWHKRFLQCLEVQEKPKRWLLKDPCHLEHIPEILKTYPDARFIHIKRDPSETIPSICSLTAMVRSGFSSSVDKNLIGSDTLEFWKNVLVKYSNARDTIDSSRLIDVVYEDLITDPISEMKKIYNNFNLDLDIKTENSMVDYLSKSSGGRKSKHVYTPEEFGLTKELIQNELSF